MTIVNLYNQMLMLIYQSEMRRIEDEEARYSDQKVLG